VASEASHPWLIAPRIAPKPYGWRGVVVADPGVPSPHTSGVQKIV
jgi:hypothetical protein